MLKVLGKFALRTAVRCLMLALVAFAIGIWVEALAAVPRSQQRLYGSPQEAAAALVSALKNHDLAALDAIFG
ncbi:MAG TPA: hypothetical protein VMD75_12775, partial [Candidatus Binataceae bacterium]|nr:hypothetical protein [Candidatus Binataceae bacterium]